MFNAFIDVLQVGSLYFWQKKKAHGFFFSMCLGWLIFCPDRVQIPELWGNSDFISPFLYLDISLQKTKKALKNQGFLWRYLFYRPLMVAETGFEPRDLRVMSPTSYQAAPLRDIYGAGNRDRTGTG